MTPQKLFAAEVPQGRAPRHRALVRAPSERKVVRVDHLGEVVLALFRDDVVVLDLPWKQQQQQQHGTMSSGATRQTRDELSAVMQTSEATHDEKRELGPQTSAGFEVLTYKIGKLGGLEYVVRVYLVY